MQSRLIQQLDATLLPHNISRQSAIFSYVLFKLAGINTNIDAALSYFNDDPYNKKQLLASFSPISIKDLTKLCDYLEFPIDDYRTDSPIPVSADIMFEKVLPDFENYLKRMRKHKSKTLEAFREKSVPLLAKNAYQAATLSTANLMTEFDSHPDRSSILADTICHLAGLACKPSDFRIEALNKRSWRIAFSFKGVKNSEAAKIVNYLQSLGDEKARITPEDEKRFMVQPTFYGFRACTIDVDSMVFYRAILPAIRDQLSTWQRENPELIEYFQAQTKGQVAKREEATFKSEAITLFKSRVGLKSSTSANPDEQHNQHRSHRR